MGQKKPKIPIGMRLICLFSILTMLVHLFTIIITVYTEIYGKEISFTTRGGKHVMISRMGTAQGIVWSIIGMALCALVILAILKRFRWGWYFVLINIAYSMVGIAIWFLFAPKEIPLSLTTYTLIILQLMILLVIVTYIFGKRSYFDV